MAPQRLGRTGTVILDGPGPKRQRTLTRTTTVARRATFRVPRSVRGVNSGFPRQLQMKHRWVHPVQLTLTSAALTPATFQVRTNGMFLPAAASHQPMYFDSMAGVYNNYTVMNARMILRVTQTGQTGSVPAAVGIYIEDDTTITPTTLGGLCEQPSSIYLMLPAMPATNVAIRQEMLFKNWNAKTVYGGDIRDNDNLQGSTAANPTTTQYFTVFVAPSVAPSAAIDYTFTLEVEYTAVWDNLKAQAAN